VAMGYDLKRKAWQSAKAGGDPLPRAILATLDWESGEEICARLPTVARARIRDMR